MKQVKRRQSDRAKETEIGMRETEGETWRERGWNREGGREGEGERDRL